ncbi:cysteine--1-D-myo-inosityl 2-amino-2-deoxy-alpha-D-glucopyranoside ligase [Cellulomonas shaoxiangyii]|uniref:L-cysteine:1D-myo-inositol 2-amino-2-deoxy-alpha-D-glucopyranoside ligase n=1 Tax=Cellulomonas shaoxiangyii TaxID=2566013 RepID=A0A4P7SHK0_9CELL|nr:cysteine--1-D-myo-inosityl 2-amino-2-deoxy-alpha-D-glucopyranoside ligase [Cellulomonas shaoxiangyii]QCB93450.1 cysteine--1-D-myo-inosityl 2-amino-2-deoxy-alpha-D-glucopyranoside ligase [Cellulomonas shaoxiangyii]TGY84567.1 cysteine--1-D-myo-inosityl 2-amino-2-deoxy-alpha-D-glucopyranoside ligase [Cellulomonas shaoxiangyii]
MLTWPAPSIPRLPGTGGPVLVRDTSSGRLVEAAPGPRAGLYVCGITPYDATHLGHAATYIAFDVLVRAWRDAGKQVTYASNVTDVDDPLLERAAATGVDWRDLAADQSALYRADMTALAVVPPDVYRGVVETVPEIADAVRRMLAAGAAYTVDTPGTVGDDVYADLAADPAFGTVAGLDEATMRALSAERGGDPDRPGKRSPLDPLLWRAERDGEPAWDAPGLGTGRPGWHIECAVIAADALGVPFDVQGGGSDLVFPHHECSDSHLRVLDEGAAARVHVHTGMVGYEGQKMSKSLGNLVLVSRLVADGVDPMAIRLAVLAHRYRDDWEWTSADLDAAQQRLATWRRALAGNGGPAAEAVLAAVRAAVADDLDTPAALAAVDGWARTALDGGVPLETGAPGVVARTVDALLGVRL